MHLSEFTLYLVYVLSGLTLITFLIGFRHIAVIISTIPLVYFFYATEKIRRYSFYLYSFDFAPQEVDFSASLQREIYARLDSYSLFYELVFGLLCIVAAATHLTLTIMYWPTITLAKLRSAAQTMLKGAGVVTRSILSIFGLATQVIVKTAGFVTASLRDVVQSLSKSSRYTKISYQNRSNDSVDQSILPNDAFMSPGRLQENPASSLDAAQGVVKQKLTAYIAEKRDIFNQLAARRVFPQGLVPQLVANLMRTEFERYKANPTEAFSQSDNKVYRYELKIPKQQSYTWEETMSILRKLRHDKVLTD